MRTEDVRRESCVRHRSPSRSLRAMWRATRRRLHKEVLTATNNARSLAKVLCGIGDVVHCSHPLHRAEGLHELKRFSSRPIAKDTRLFDRGWQDGIDRHAAMTDSFDQRYRTTFAGFVGQGEARQRESSCRAPAASGWKVAPPRPSTAPSCWSSRARALSSPREGQSRSPRR
jgi:hypothetical protein